MAEPASAVIALIVTGLKTWSVFDALIKAVSNSPADAQHWAVVSDVLKNSCSLMKERLERWRATDLTPTQEKYLASIGAHLEHFQEDLSGLGIPDADAFYGGNPSFRDKVMMAFRSKLDQDDHLIKRVDRSIQIFQISASVLSQLDSGPVERVREVLNELGTVFPRLSTDDQKLQIWRQTTQALLTDTATQRFRENPDPSNAQTDNLLLPSSGRRKGSVRELQYKFEAAQNWATRFFEADMPILALPFQRQAIELGKELREQQPDYTLDMAERVNLAEKYVDIAISCQKHDQTAVSSAVERLDMLGSTVLAESRPHTTPKLCDEQRRIAEMFADLNETNKAIDFFRHAIDDYVRLGKDDYHREICETYNLTVGQYQRSRRHIDVDAFRAEMRDELGDDFVPRRDGLARAVAWCTSEGFIVTGEDELTFTQTTNKDGDTPLHVAARDRGMNISVLEELMTLEEFYEMEDRNGDTPLLVAVSNSNIEVLKKLLTRPYLVLVRDANRQTPIHRCRDKETLRIVLQAVETVRSLPSRPELENIDIDTKDGYGQTALHLFCYQLQAGLVKILVEKGANVNALCSGDRTPLMLALRQGQSEAELHRIIRVLVCRGAHTIGKDRYGQNDVQKALLRKGYDQRKISKLKTGDSGSSTMSAKSFRRASTKRGHWPAWLCLSNTRRG
ncbi:uncharacterized protein NECHADRAFT_88066 [Fusarium vanettenii 77-13-4]|uniref:Uncharacterized protein n=1 Tax=Fusarium vanettenii (strain ATCC MYA-4622 / CBS 123669 / FGSC 9596 / NRRL 45880 / 77-13-4) TaxID=660122 RepID=C7ZL54_FUSV7|nr:uncharacterized protein NECHADRAFT_88066 [Fusarium vanettenii 77-13-4]EEU35230.1 hypothetical protein NECHADRAFT_88066 [Fusarium vanettenii 77-13-4]